MTGSLVRSCRTAWTVTAYSVLGKRSLSCTSVTVGSRRICRWTGRGETTHSNETFLLMRDSQSHQAVTTRFEHNFYFSFLWTAFPFSYWFFFFLRCVTGHKSNLFCVCKAIHELMSPLTGTRQQWRLKKTQDKETKGSHLFGFGRNCGVGWFVGHGVAGSAPHWLPLHVHGGWANIVNVQADHRHGHCRNEKADTFSSSVNCFQWLSGKAQCSYWC